MGFGKVYDKNREFVLTSSPSMDILISSNLERLIYRICGDDPVMNKEFMESLQNTGVYHITKEMKEQLESYSGGYASEAETAATIKELYERNKNIGRNTWIQIKKYKGYL